MNFKDRCNSREILDSQFKLCNAGRYQRTQSRTDTRAGYYQKKLHTKAGEVQLNVPKLRQQKFETAIIERYKRRESSVEEAMIEMYHSAVLEKFALQKGIKLLIWKYNYGYIIIIIF